ncbi:hypothetical protein FIBSPDRAFT_918987 [Athelia psychrophila]|uniref:DUF155 domain-containing protein n=1 Tax=Athelia psychrophila TaxID=1759441 RepID=A0A166MAF2_9AGAM|nr:hypothetical protein FIBSPDRAFT_918987 [Fibularhizoctonia sp. CBS 109695]
MQKAYAQLGTGFRSRNSLTRAVIQTQRLALRSYATARSSAELGDPSKPKPKASTPLRRTASKSLPIRSNPTPTRGDIQTVFTLATAERYVLPALRGSLPPQSQKLHESWWVPRWGENGKEGEVFVFSNGSFVTWGLAEADARRFADTVLSKPGFQIGSLREPETEELEFVTDPTEATRLQGDLIILGQVAPFSSDGTVPGTLPPTILPQETLLARYAFSQALSRSTALSALEVSLEDYISSVSLLPHSLEQTGKPGLDRTAVIKKLGGLMKFRQILSLNRENFTDTPDLYWGEPELETFFNSVSEALEVKARTHSVNEKITYAAEVQSVLRQLLTESSTHRMELIIIALIAVEVVIAIIHNGPDLWDMATGGSKKSNESEI